MSDTRIVKADRLKAHFENAVTTNWTKYNICTIIDNLSEDNGAFWKPEVERNGFGSFTRLVCSHCGNWRAQAPLNFCANCGKQMKNPNIDQELIDQENAKQSEDKKP